MRYVAVRRLVVCSEGHQHMSVVLQQGLNRKSCEATRQIMRFNPLTRTGDDNHTM